MLEALRREGVSGTAGWGASAGMLVTLLGGSVVLGLQSSRNPGVSRWLGARSTAAKLFRKESKEIQCPEREMGDVQTAEVPFPLSSGCRMFNTWFSFRLISSFSASTSSFWRITC